MRRLSFVIPLALIPLTGCAVVYEGTYDWRDGWRQGRIERIGPVAGMPWRPDCAAIEGSAADAGYALVQYPRSRSSNLRVLPLPDANFVAGDLVYVNVSHCAQPLKHRSAVPAVESANQNH